MTPKKLRYPLVRALGTTALASLALLAACEAKLPTAEEMNNMTALTATKAVDQFALMDTTRVTYYVDDAVVTKDSANRIAPELIAAVNVKKDSATFNEVRIVTHRGMNAVKPGERTTIELKGPRAQVAFRNTTRDSSGKVIENNGFNGLLVVDGVITDPARVSTIDPDRIATVNIVKGAAATALYSDPRAANGVIQITTKKTKP